MVVVSYFNPRSRKGSDLNQFADLLWQYLISTHAPARGATKLFLGLIKLPFYFNPRSRKGSDAYVTTCCGVVNLFQPTLPQGERLSPLLYPAGDGIFQPTLPQGERRVCFHWFTVTFINFNPRSRKGSDAHSMTTYNHVNQFQPTLPQGERRLVVVLFAVASVISTHAPARGAT